MCLVVARAARRGKGSRGSRGSTGSSTVQQQGSPSSPHSESTAAPRTRTLGSGGERRGAIAGMRDMKMGGG
jgi:hypothetical protein